MLTEKIKETIEIIKTMDINGCITGSSLLDVDFDTWESVPDIDVFVYNEYQLQHAVDMFMHNGFEPLNNGEIWKIDRLHNEGVNRKMPLTTIKLKRDEVIVNLTWKWSRTSLFGVLQSFDMSIIMRGIDIPTGCEIDLRCGWPGMVKQDPKGLWSPDPNVAYPNPLRKQDADMYTVEQWVRQFDRCIKYWNRGFDTRPMAQFYIDLITSVIEKGKLFSTERADEAFNEFVEVYTPVRQTMIDWLDARKEC